MRWVWVFVVLSTSCVGRVWVPRLALNVRIARPIASPSEMDWRVGAAMYLSEPAPQPVVIESAPREATFARSRCADTALCAWEERARALAIARIEREEEP